MTGEQRATAGFQHHFRHHPDVFDAVMAEAVLETAAAYKPDHPVALGDAFTLATAAVAYCGTDNDFEGLEVHVRRYRENEGKSPTWVTHDTGRLYSYHTAGRLRQGVSTPFGASRDVSNVRFTFTRMNLLRKQQAKVPTATVHTLRPARVPAHR